MNSPGLLATSRRTLAQACRLPEAVCVAELVAALQPFEPDAQTVGERASTLIEALRKQRKSASGVDHLMHEFALSSQEGIALMCLAEALLRIPDRATMDALIRDKLSRGDWRAHLGNSPSLFVNAATWGLMLSGRLLATHSEQSLGGALTTVLARGGEPVIRRGVEFAMTLLGRQFVMGETIEAALARSATQLARGYTCSFDMLGEAAMTADAAEAYCSAYEQAIHAIGRASAGSGPVAGPGISVKLSALHPRYVRAQRARVMDELYPRLLKLVQLAREYNIGINIDAEESERLELSLDLVERLLEEATLGDWDGLGIVVQAYQKRAPHVLDHLILLARHHGRRLMIRLVKGAYWDSEIKRAQIEGQVDYPVFTRKVHTDLSYLACAQRLLAAADCIYPQFATHNAHTLAYVQSLAQRQDVKEYEFQCLHGMGEGLYDQLVGRPADGARCRIYAPVGSHATLLPYLVRRLLENGANSSFVNRIVDPAVGIAELIRDPLAETREQGGRPHAAIPRPSALFPDGRRNSSGLDLANDEVIESLQMGLEQSAKQSYVSEPLIAQDGSSSYQPEAAHASGRVVYNPAQRAERVGTVRDASSDEIELALECAARGAREWAACPPAQRAALLLRCGDLLEEEQGTLISLCVREAGKTWSNAVAELREAVDFCRYYAAQALHLRADSATEHDLTVCISPWNFPLAILVGQISAALAAGQTVLAKPAEQSSLIAAAAVALMHRAGIPRTALQLLPGDGAAVGGRLIADCRVGKVVFTGSTEVARLIQRTLLTRPEGTSRPLLIAETGGQNNMIVDSSALTEQVVQDVMSSAFDSAGQRCSALRVLCLQEDIADDVLGMLKAAMHELRIGDPSDLSSDVGPLIDEEAHARVEAHVATLREQGCRVTQCRLPDNLGSTLYFPPTLVEIATLDQLSAECFGPVVHVLRFAGSRIDALVGEINTSGYGLTFGMHSRIDERIDQVTERIRAGNVYINRNMVGAVVGMQPFGGEGKSGTGPKAGGPLYVRTLQQSPITPASLDLTGASRGRALPEKLSVLRQWAAQHDDPGLAQRCSEYAADSLLFYTLALPGPTGEENRLQFLARGLVLCAAEDEPDLLDQLSAVYATGNTPALAPTATNQALLRRLPQTLMGDVVFLDDEVWARVRAVLFKGDAVARKALQAKVLELEQAIVPIIEADGQTGRYAVHALVREQVISVNTAAAGGNTSLMTLAQ